MGLRFQRQVDSAIILENMLATQENSYFFLIEKGTGSFSGQLLKDYLRSMGMKFIRHV